MELLVPANVNETDITGTGDDIVVHTITTVLDLPKNVSQLAQRYIEKPAILVGLERAELLAEIESTPDVTILDPRVPASTINDIPEDTLADVLRYHIVKDTLYFLTAQIESGVPATLPTLQGGSITMTIEEAAPGFNETFYDDVRVLRGDFIVANGIVHDIESLLDPTRATTTPTSNSTASPNGTDGDNAAQSTGDGARLSTAGCLILLIVCAAAMV
ncbi:Putative FAS1 domain-containing protein [Septoria linicola]|uniref:FAS1 domain-containing protein n=1 Tax=Septoria linicola TaxID=215465 RepID=A0A9Q9AWA5_9PEZI|nr:Putative FAS1 domain-containing protein [Septoria linicola]